MSSKYTLRQKVWLWAFYCRVTMVCLQVVLSFVVPKDQSEAGFTWVRTDPADDQAGTSGADDKDSEEFESAFKPDDLKFGDEDEELLHRIFSMRNVTDLVLGGFIAGNQEINHCLHVANNGYTYESNLALMPAFPMAVRGLADLLYKAVRRGLSTSGTLPSELYPALLQVSSLVLNSFAFVLAADRLYILSRLMLRDEYLAYKSALLFATSPGSVMLTVPTPDALMVAASFAAFCAVESHGLNLKSGLHLAAVTLTGASGAATGMLFVLYRSMRTVAKETILYVRSKKKLLPKFPQPPPFTAAASTPIAPPSAATAMASIMTEALGPGVLNILMILGPFAAHQWYCYAAFCPGTSVSLPWAVSNVSRKVWEYGMRANLTMPYALEVGIRHVRDVAVRPAPDWCQHEPPLSYYRVLLKSWGIEPDDINPRPQLFYSFNESASEWPFLAFSAPIYALLFWQSARFLDLNRGYCIRLGLVDNNLLGLGRPRRSNLTTSFHSRSLPRECFIYLVHAVVIAAVGLTALPIQVASRLLLCATPVIYWTAAVVTTPDEDKLVPIPPLNQTDSVPAGAVERASNLTSPFKCLLFQETQSDDELGNWTRLWFFSTMVLGVVLHTAGIKYLI